MNVLNKALFIGLLLWTNFVFGYLGFTKMQEPSGDIESSLSATRKRAIMSGTPCK